MTATNSEEEPSEIQTPLAAHKASPDRTVFTEEGNTDGWIATDLTVPIHD